LPFLQLLRVTSNIAVPVLLLVCVALLFDGAAMWFGAEPYISCTVMPTWEALAEPFASLLTIAALLWLILSRLRSTTALVLLCLGIVLGTGPLVMAYALNPLC